jgi:folylpolyglutamate synthase/dihydropteroate synthase
MKRLYEYFNEFYEGRYVITVFGILADKDSNKMLTELSRFTNVIIITKPMTDKAANTDVLARQASHMTGDFQVIPHVREAVKTAIDNARPDDVVLVTGSHYTVGEVLSHSDS